MSNVGLYLGTFNPIHNGHVRLAKYFSELPELDQVLVVISPQSPFKIEDTFINDIDRLELAKTIFKKFKNVKVSDIEFKMSKPNFTIDTLKEFKKITNTSVLLNTSFNIAGEPLVETIEDAIRTFRKSEIDILWFPEINKMLHK